MSPKEKKYTERIAVFFTKDQLEKIRADAERLGLDVSVYVRMAALREQNEKNLDELKAKLYDINTKQIEEFWERIEKANKVAIENIKTKETSEGF